MGDPWYIIGWAVICFGVAVGLFSLFIVVPYAQVWHQGWERKRADAGKVKCYDKKCSKVATNVTPHGYFCRDHEGENSTKYSSIGSWRWSHPLNHTLKGGWRV